MTPAPHSIQQALVEVRKAYRLLHDFQRASLDAVSYVANELGFRYEGGSGCFSDDSPNDLGCWAWDWLPMFLYDFTFQPRQCGDKEVRFAVWLFSDTGYFLSEDAAAERTDVKTFAPAERSGTKVGFFFFRTWEDEFDKFAGDKEAIRRFLENHGELPPSLKSGGVVATCYDFSRLADDDSTDELIADLVQLARKKGLQVDRVKKSRKPAP